MKVLIDCHHPFAFAHGGMQIQIEQTLAALNASGVNAEPSAGGTISSEAMSFISLGRSRQRRSGSHTGRG